MPSEHLTADEFFSQISELFTAQRQKDHGSIHLTQKRLTYDGTDSKPPPTSPTTSAPFADLAPSQPLPILIRATNGKSLKTKPGQTTPKLKISTIVQADDLESFFMRYAEVCKASMTGLKKRDRSKRKAKKGKKKDGAGTKEDVKA